MERRHNNTEVRTDDKKITGYASVFYDGTKASEFQLWKGAVERIDPDAFNRAIKEKHDVRALYNHDPDNLLGRLSSNTLNLSVDNKGLRYEIEYDEHDSDHQRVRSKIQRGDLTGSSFAFRVTGEKWEEENDQEVRTITDLDLIDVGPVTFPAYESSTTGVRHASEARSSYDKWQNKLATERRLQKLEQMKTI
ncbi:MAG: HK97 family phage prohead protease [Pirellulaceae bacterium]